MCVTRFNITSEKRFADYSGWQSWTMEEYNSLVRRPRVHHRLELFSCLLSPMADKIIHFFYKIIAFLVSPFVIVNAIVLRLIYSFLWNV